MSAHDGGPAFPAAYEFNPCDGKSHPMTLSGMSLRDYFAGQAMSGMLGASWTPVPNEATITDRSKVAQWAYAFADAMLKARAK